MKYFLSIFLFLFSLPALACDFDGDGIDETLSYDTSSGSMVWNYIQSSNSSLISTVFGDASDFPVPGKYLGSSSDYLLATLDVDYAWSALKPDGDVDLTTFVRPDASYITGKDFNGDGVTDLVKFFNRCNQLTRFCYKNNLRIQYLLVDTDGNETFIRASSTPVIGGSFGKGLSPLFSIDVNGDGKDDICYAKNLKKRPKVFTIQCRNALDETNLKKQRVGRLFNIPIGLKVQGEADSFALWKAKKRKSATNIKIFKSNGDLINIDIPVLGKVLTGDWIDDSISSDQVAVVNDQVLYIYNPRDDSYSTKVFPSGIPLDCKNNLWGKREGKYLTSKNVCKVLKCK